MSEERPPRFGAQKGQIDEGIRSVNWRRARLHISELVDKLTDTKGFGTPRMLRGQETSIAAITHGGMPRLPRVHAHRTRVVRLRRLHTQKLAAPRSIETCAIQEHTDARNAVKLQGVDFKFCGEVIIFFGGLQFQIVGNNCETKYEFRLETQPRWETMKENLPRFTDPCAQTLNVDGWDSNYSNF